MFLLARVRLSQRRHKAAIDLLKGYLGHSSHGAAAHALTARALSLHNKVGRSLRHAQKAVKLAPGEPRYKRLLGEILLRYRRPGEAEKAIRSALSRLPKSAWCWCLLGDALWAQNKYNEALVAYKKGAGLSKDGKAWQASALDKMGTLLHSRKRTKKAREILETCNRLFPKLGCPYTEAALSPPDPTRPHERERFVKRRGKKKRFYEK